MDFEIVPIKEEYVESFHKALDAVCRERKYLAMFEAYPIESTRQFILNNIKNEIPQFIVLCENEVVGWCDIIPDNKKISRHCGRLGMGVIKKYRHHGLGEKLLNATIEKAKEIGLERVELEVFEDNEIAINLYKKNGFEFEGKRINSNKIDGKYINSILMAKFL